VKKQSIAVLTAAAVLLVSVASSQAQTIVEQESVSFKGKNTSGDKLTEADFGGDLSMVTIASGGSTNTWIGSGIKSVIDTNTATTNLVGVSIWYVRSSVDSSKGDKSVQVLDQWMFPWDAGSNSAAVYGSLTSKVVNSTLVLNTKKSGGKVEGVLKDGSEAVKGNFKAAKAKKAKKSKKS